MRSTSRLLLMSIPHTSPWKQRSHLPPDETHHLFIDEVEWSWLALIVDAGEYCSVLVIQERRVDELSLFSFHRKIRCDGGDPCTNCVKTCRSCDYTPVPADLNSNRRRRALTESQDVSPPDNGTENGEIPSVLSKNDVSISQSLPSPVQPIPGATGQQPPRPLPNANNVRYPRALEGAKQVGHAADSLPPTAEPVRMSSGLGNNIPANSVPGQQMQWALVPVWSPDVTEHVQPSQLTAPMPGFSSGRIMHNHIPSLNIPQMDPSAVYHSVPPYQQGNMGNPFTTGVSPGFMHNSLQLQQVDMHTASMRSCSTAQMPYQTHGIASATNMSSMPHQFSTSAEGQTIGQDTRQPDFAFGFFNLNGPRQPTAYPLESSSTSTSFSSQGFGNAAPVQACGSSVGSPPYTPLPQSTISGYAATGHDMFGQQQEEMKHVYAPAMMMHMPPVTPALASPIKQHNHILAQTGMVGLGIMMPGM